MLNLDDNLAPEEIRSRVKAYEEAHGLRDLWWELQHILYRVRDGYLAHRHWPSRGTAVDKLFETRNEARGYLDKDPEEGNVLVHVIEMDWAREFYRLSRLEVGERLRLYEQGNNACPICLKPFMGADVEAGESVILQKVSLGGETVSICLKCRSCDATPGRDVAVRHRRRTKATLELAGVPYRAYLKVGDDGAIVAEFPRSFPRPESFRNHLAEGRKLELTLYNPSSHDTKVAWLKTAYLAVFSLLGEHGYRYVKGKAVEPVRQQLMEPERQLIKEFAFTNDKMTTFGMLMNQRGIPCWAVIMQECVVVLPTGEDTTFYDHMSSVWPGGRGELGGGPLWYLARFGEVRSGNIAFKANVDIGKIVDGNLFGRRGRAEKDGVTTEFVIADWSGQEVTTLNVAGLQDSES